MGVLDKPTVAASDTKTHGYEPVRVRRGKLADALQNQIGMLQATMAGGTFRKALVKRKRDLERRTVRRGATATGFAVVVDRCR